MDIMNEREMLRKVEKETIKSWLDQIGCHEPVGYWYNYVERNLVLYTSCPGRLIGKNGKDIEILREKLNSQMAGTWTIELAEIKGGFIVSEGDLKV